MYKKLHKTETHSNWNPYCHKGSLFMCLLERVIMLTKDVYDIQFKNRKNSCDLFRSFFGLYLVLYGAM